MLSGGEVSMFTSWLLTLRKLACCSSQLIAHSSQPAAFHQTKCDSLITGFAVLLSKALPLTHGPTVQNKQSLIALITGFVKEIGLAVTLAPVDTPSFLPGILIAAGGLRIDADRLLYPGDILHEAGHLAVQPYSIRCTMDGDLPDTDVHRGGELMTLAWSYAAALHLGISPAIVFHEHGYKGSHASLLSAFENGHYIGLPMLQYHGMACDAANAALRQLPPFPHMLEWVCTKP